MYISSKCQPLFNCVSFFPSLIESTTDIVAWKSSGLKLTCKGTSFHHTHVYTHTHTRTHTHAHTRTRTHTHMRTHTHTHTHTHLHCLQFSCDIHSRDHRTPITEPPGHMTTEHQWLEDHMIHITRYSCTIVLQIGSPVGRKVQTLQSDKYAELHCSMLLIRL